MTTRSVICLILTLGLTACTKSEDEGAALPPPSNPVAVNADSGAAAPVAVAPMTPPPVAPPGTAALAPADMGSKEEYNGEVVARDDDGKRLDGEALLKKAMMFHVEGQGHPYPTRIEELVELGTLKSLPPAPNGQKWAIDPNTRQIILQ